MVLEIAQNINKLDIIILEFMKIVAMVGAIFSVVVIVFAYWCGFFIKPLGIMPPEAYLDREIARYAKMHKETEDEQVKKILLEEITCLRKQKIARKAVRITCSHWVFDMPFILVPIIPLIIVKWAEEEYRDLTDRVILIGCAASFSIMLVFSIIGIIIKHTTTVGVRRDLYDFYLAMLETDYKEIVDTNPYKILEKYVKVIKDKKYKKEKKENNKKKIWSLKIRNLVLFPHIIDSQNQAANEVVKLLDEESKKEANNIWRNSVLKDKFELSSQEKFKIY